MAKGQCFCGAVQFDAQMPSKWVAHCHCSMCRRAHGAAFVTWVGMDAQRCTTHDPDNSLHWFASSPGAERGFCTRCGSTIFFRSGQWAGELHIALANFDEPVDRGPQVHAFWDTHVDWAAIDPDDGLPRKTPA